MGTDDGQLPLEQLDDVFVKLAGFIGPALNNLWDGKNAAAENKNRYMNFGIKKLLSYLKTEHADKILTTLLKSMGLLFSLNKDLRRNIEDFHGRYLFRIKERDIAITADFHKHGINVYERRLKNSDIAITFRDPKTLMEFLLSPKPDILGSLLKQDVSIDGNINFLFKFAYMAKHLQLMMMGQR